ncbi:MAG: 5-formyltetrahydrofolate cyclo-ligase [Myxococcota bacterium]
METKDDLRRQLRSRRDAVSSERRAELSAAICEHFLAEPSVAAASKIALYSAIGSEVDTCGLFGRLRERGAEVCFPRSLRATGAVEFCMVEDLDELRPGAFGVLEPVGEPTPPAVLDVVAVPGIAFDHAGGRLGYGAGYYDRTLASYRGRSIGLTFDCQLVDALPVDEHDRRMDVIVTESGAIEVSSATDPVRSHDRGPPCRT